MNDDEIILELRKFVYITKLFMLMFDLRDFSKANQLQDFDEKTVNVMREIVSNFMPDLEELESQQEKFDEFIMSKGSELLKEKESDVGSLIFDYFLHREKINEFYKKSEDTPNELNESQL